MDDFDFDDDDCGDNLHVANMYEIVHDSLKPYLTENKVPASDIIAALGLIIGEVSQMYAGMDCDCDDDCDFDWESDDDISDN